MRRKGNGFLFLIMSMTTSSSSCAGRSSSSTERHKAAKLNDTIEWLKEIAVGCPYDAAAAQITFAISAMHTTSELLKRALLDICMSP